MQTPQPAVCVGPLPADQYNHPRRCWFLHFVVQERLKEDETRGSKKKEKGRQTLKHETLAK